MQCLLLTGAGKGGGVNEEHRAWGPQLYLCRQYQIYFALVGNRWRVGCRRGKSSGFEVGASLWWLSKPPCLSSVGQEPNQLLSNHMRHKQPCSQRRPLQALHTMIATLDCEPRWAGSCLSHLSPHLQGLGRGLVWDCKVAGSLSFHKETEAQKSQACEDPKRGTLVTGTEEQQGIRGHSL